jgi:sulfatase maturation enzyme AslB (radical SAM superfamily)
MSVELRPLGVACNIQCQYCYQNPQRDAGNVPRSYDLDAMKAAVEREGGPITLFGGEALLVPEPAAATARPLIAPSDNSAATAPSATTRIMTGARGTAE